MRKPDLFHSSIGALVQAFFNGTLNPKMGCACAVGNILAKSNDYDIKHNPNKPFGFMWVDSDGQTYFPYWTNLVREVRKPWRFTKYQFDFSYLLGIVRGKQEIERSGYTVEEIIRIEDAFLKQIPYDIYDHEAPEDFDNFRGLMDVVDELMLIHEASVEEAEIAKQLFVKA